MAKQSLNDYIEQQKKYEEEQKQVKLGIKQQYKGWSKLWRLCWFYIKKPWHWLRVNCKDLQTWLILIIVGLVIGVSVWLPGLLSIIVPNKEFKEWCLGIATASLVFWNLPGTPYIAICIAITMGIKEIINKIKIKRFNKK